MNSIVIPENLPEILKKYVKAAIRSQPEDIVSWSAKYFKSTDDQCISLGTNNNIMTTQKQDRTLFRILAFQVSIRLYINKLCALNLIHTVNSEIIVCS